MSDESQDHGEDQKSQDDDKDKQENEITLTKEKLSEKIIGGRDEGIQKGVKDTLSAVNETLGTEFTDLDSLSEGLSEAHIGDITESEVVQELKDKLSEKDEKISNLSNKIQDIRISDTVKSDLNNHLDNKELLVDYDDLKSLHEKNSDVGYVEKDGEVYATKDGNRILNDEGEYATYAESMYNYAKEKGLIKGNAKGGAGGGTVESSGGDENPFKTGNATKQAQLWKKNPKKAKRLKKASGK